MQIDLLIPKPQRRPPRPKRHHLHPELPIKRTRRVEVVHRENEVIKMVDGHALHSTTRDAECKSPPPQLRELLGDVEVGLAGG